MLPELGGYKRLTGTANVKASQGGILGFYVSSTTAGTIQFYDDAATGTTTPITGVITPAVGSNGISCAFGQGLYAVITGTLDVTIIYF